MAGEGSDEVEKSPFDDGLPWGYISQDGVWRPLPKTPMILAEMGPPPFWVTLPSGEVRYVIHEPPGHTDLMVSPESIDAFMEQNPLPE